jgi:hypothetical protein
MTEPAPAAAPAPLLRTLSPALRGLERGLRGWLDGPHRYPLSMIARATLEGLATDLQRQGDALDVDRPLLVIMLMGGTGVGKSTLLNALAGGNIAAASFTRPTTRDPVVYYHQSVRPEKLDPALRHCRLIPHDRPALEQKVLVDTPDLDSNDLANRDKLVRLLPVADIVLYVGSQEKYHDQVGWQLFLEHRQRRAFAFVLNKWDRCVHAGVGGVRPDEDLLRDLKSEGFESPLLFRTCAQLWLDRALQVHGNGQEPPAEPPEDEQMLDLVQWLEAGLTRLEIEAIKAKGVSQLLGHLREGLEAACPPDLSDVAERVRVAWERPLAEEAQATSEVLLATLEPYQREIEHHFSREGQRRFRGIMAGYLHLVTRARYVGSTLRSRIPFMPRGGSEDEQSSSWDLATFTRACSDAAGNRQLDARGKALANRLLIDADAQGFPVGVLTEAVESRAGMDWRQRYTSILNEVLHQVEQQWTRPTGRRRLVETLLVWTTDWVPPLTLLAALVMLLVRYFDPWGAGYQVSTFDVVLPGAVLLCVLILLHVLITILLPMRWPTIRSEFSRKLQERISRELAEVYSPAAPEVAEMLRKERQQVEKMMADTDEVASWLEKREQSANIAGLYGR